MKKLKIIHILLFLFFITSTIFYCIHTEVSPPAFSKGELFNSPNNWKFDEDDQILAYSLKLPDKTNQERLLLLQSHWNQYEISVDNSEVWHTTGTHVGTVHLFSLPQGNTLVIRFLHVNALAAKAIKTSSIYTGDKDGIYSFIIRNNLHALIFTCLTLVLGLTCICAGLYLKSVLTLDIRKGILDLGAYILLTGLWVFTDSKLLVFVTQKTGLVEMVSFITFFILPVPLLYFTRHIITVNEKIFQILKNLFLFMLAVYMVHYVFGILPLPIIIVMEHLLMMVTILAMLHFGFLMLKQRKNKKVICIMLGYIIFSVFSILAFFFYYKGNDFGYSITYVFGILGFILFLAAASCTVIYEQLEENADIALRAKMTGTDMLTGLGNRTAFALDQMQDQDYQGTLAYIMVDANNLKKINDTLGHHKGDELLKKLAHCIQNIDGINEGKYRIGGDEFVIRLRNVSQQQTVDYICQLQNEIDCADRSNDIDISAAIGYAWSQETVKNLDQLLQQADAAMYENKQKMKQNRT